uniref:Nose resistant-to-fluoxetine protein N-terminal domain-containing protein n=1 Tax=Anopheles farauti TaxID=69004 RepID=A0A182QD03_9DIPT
MVTIFSTCLRGAMLFRWCWQFGLLAAFALAADEQPLFGLARLTETLQSIDVRYLGNETLCDQQLLALVAGVQDKEFWTLKLLDSWGKWPAGIFSGNLYELGHYDQCVDMQYGSDRTLPGMIRGRYCFLTVPLENLLPPQQQRIMPGTSGDLWAVRLGACIPAACTAQHFQQFLNKTVPNLPPVRLACNSVTPPLGTAQWIAIAVFTVIALLALGSTLYETVTLCRGGTPRRNLVIFSLYGNGRKLLATKRRVPEEAATKSGTIDCINGIRVISMAWVVFSHNYTRVGMEPLINSHAILPWLESYHSVLVVASTVSVDTFFLLSGLLTCWSILNALDKRGRLSLPMMYLHRYLRLTPTLAALILFSAALMRHAGSGPFWDGAMSLTTDTCQKYWWSALLYVQNYVNPREICLGHTWYLSVDMQLYLLSPFIIYPLWRWGRRMLLAVVALIVASMVTVFTVFLVHDLRLSFLAVDGERIRHIHTYYPTHTRAGAWLVGVIFGYLLQRTKKHYVLLPRWSIVVGWAGAGFTMLAVLFADHPIQQPNYHELPVAVDATYEALNRVLWAAAVGWIVFACVNGYGGVVNEFLGATVWQPLGRLSYSIYLLHLPIQVMMAGTIRVPYYFTDVHAVYQFWGDIGFTLTLALFWTLLFESPIIGLERILFGLGRESSKPKDASNGRNGIDQHAAAANNHTVLPKTLSLTLQTARL